MWLDDAVYDDDSFLYIIHGGVGECTKNDLANNDNDEFMMNFVSF